MIKTEVEDDVTTEEHKPLVRFEGSLAPLPVQLLPLSMYKPFTCDICRKGVRTRGGLKYHIQAHLTGRIFRCDQCEKCYSTKNDLETHFKRHLQQFTCDHCDRKFPAKEYIQSHIAAAHLPRTIPCVDCCKKPKLFATLRELYVHKKSKLQSRKIRFRCKLCGIKFESKKAYDKHCEQRELFKYKCKTCAEQFPCYKLLNAHTREEKTVRFCKMCNVWVTNFLRHTSLYHRICKCDICPFETNVRSKMYDHLKTCGSEEQIRALGHCCAVCNDCFRTKVQLEAHRNQKHPKYFCRECSRSFQTEANYQGHVRSHKKRFKEHHYKCVGCVPPKNFGSLEKFNRHFDSMHCRLGKGKHPTKTLWCLICSKKSFETPARMENHIIRTHMRHMMYILENQTTPV